MSRPSGQQESKSYQSSDPVNLDSDKRGVWSKLASSLETSTIKLENHDYSSILRVTFTLLLLREGPGMSRPLILILTKGESLWHRGWKTSTINLENHDYSSILRVTFTLLFAKRRAGDE